MPAHAGVFRLICERSGWAGESGEPRERPSASARRPGRTRQPRAPPRRRPQRRCPQRPGLGRDLRESAPDEQARALVTQLAVETLRTPGADGEPDARYVAAVLARVEELAVSRQISRVKSRLQRMDPVAAQAEYNRLFGDLIGLEQRRKVLIERASGAL